MQVPGSPTDIKKQYRAHLFVISRKLVLHKVFIEYPLGQIRSDHVGHFSEEQRLLIEVTLRIYRFACSNSRPLPSPLDYLIWAYYNFNSLKSDESTLSIHPHDSVYQYSEVL